MTSRKTAERQQKDTEDNGNRKAKVLVPVGPKVVPPSFNSQSQHCEVCLWNGEAQAGNDGKLILPITLSSIQTVTGEWMEESGEREREREKER